MRRFYSMFFAAMAAVMMGFVMTSCSDDDNPSTGEDQQYITNEQLAKLGCYTDLHLHLDGSLSIKAARKLAHLQDITLDMSDEELRKQLQVDEGCQDLNEYLEKFAFPGTLLQTSVGITESIKILAQELKDLGYIYAEIRFAPQKHCQKGLTQREVIEASIKGKQEAALPVSLILCCMRGDDNHEENLETVRLAAEYLDKGVAAIDIAGAEALFPTSGFADLFQLAKANNVPFTIHAGEADGPESVKIALDYGTKRIGHGVRSAEDTSLMQRLSDEGITLECCPTSNLNTAIFPSISQFPYRLFLDKNVKFTINSDNMAVSATNVIREFQLLNDSFHLTYSEVKQLLMHSIDASFASESLKKELRANVNKAFLQNSNTFAKQKLD